MSSPFRESIIALRRKVLLTITEIEGRLQDVARNEELIVLNGRLDDEAWEPFRKEINEIHWREEPTQRNVKKLITCVLDVLAVTPVRPRVLRVHRSEIKRIRLVATGGKVGLWDRCQADLNTLKTKLDHLLTDTPSDVGVSPSEPQSHSLRKATNLLAPMPALAASTAPEQPGQLEKSEREKRRALFDEAAATLRGRGVRLTQIMVAKKVGWGDRSIVGWWVRAESRSTPDHDRKIRCALNSLSG